MSAHSEHFRIEEVAPGVWAALAGPTGACVSNAGIIDLGDRTLVFDTFMTPQAGRDLREAAERLTGRPAALVVNSHHHDDHIRGNQAFGSADIIGTVRMIELIESGRPGDLDVYAEGVRAWIADLDRQLADPEVPARNELALSRRMAGEVLASLPDLTITVPTSSFADELIVEGEARQAHLLSYGGGHTDSDAFVFLPDCGVLFAGDLLWVESHPWGGDGHLDEWIDIVYRMNELRPRTVVPGHGTVAAFEYARVFSRYLTFLCDIVRQAEASSMPVVKLADHPIPPEYGGWDATRRFRTTLEALGRRAGLPAA
ncbi:MAG: MBL fold metallo-hydrolase [Acidimicrobiia bacterium]|nr:MBL fold metallo-hydrolase [Acidimicrobiia bacterium]